MYGRDTNTVLAGQCAALNVRSWDHHVIKRGNVIAVPGYFAAKAWYLLRLRLLAPAVSLVEPQEKRFLKNGTRVKFHTGTSEVIAAVYPLEGQAVRAGEECFAQVRLEQPLVAGPADRFIIRSFSPPQTIGGGIIIEATPHRLKRDRREVLADLAERTAALVDEKKFVEYCVRGCDGLAASEEDIARRAKVLRSRLTGILEALISEQKIVRLSPSLYMHGATLARAGAGVVAIVKQFHAQFPESPGIERDGLLAAWGEPGLPRRRPGEPGRTTSGMAKAVLEPVVGLLVKEGRLVERSRRLAVPEHRQVFAKEDEELMARIESLFRAAPFAPPSPDEVVQTLGRPANEVRRIIRILCENDHLVQVAEEMFLHREAVDRAKDAVVSHIRKEGRLESVDFKYLIDTTRKYALPLLDYFDRVGITNRVGNTRYLKQN